MRRNVTFRGRHRQRCVKMEMRDDETLFCVRILPPSLYDLTMALLFLSSVH